MNDYVLSCCSAVDLTAEHLKERNIACAYYHYELDGEYYLDDLGKSMPYETFYQKMADGASTKTSAISSGEYEEYFESFLKEGKDVLHLTLSSGITSTINAANIAKSALEEKYPDRKLIIVDSLCASCGYGLLMDKLADKRDEGYTIEQLADYATENRMKVACTFFSTDLTFFIRGGRVSKAAGAFGMALGICPMFMIDRSGKLVITDKIRTRKKAIRAIYEIMEENAQDGLQYNGKCYICHSNCEEDAEALASLIRLNFPNLAEPITIGSVGTIIGAHAGPGMVGLVYFGKEREK